LQSRLPLQHRHNDTAVAQPYPSKPIKIIVIWPGGPNDLPAASSEINARGHPVVTRTAAPAAPSALRAPSHR
jgi:hypothetical protein